MTTYLLVAIVLWPRIPALVGKWQVRGGPSDGLTLELHAKGEFHARLGSGAKQMAIHAVAEVQGDQMEITSTDTTTREEVIKIPIIRNLTDIELMLEDPSGLVSRLVRVPSTTRAD